MIVNNEIDEELPFDSEGGDPLLTRREVAARCRVPLSTFDSLRRQARVPFPDAHMGKHILWRASTIEAFLDAGGTRVGA